jgi:hypothetical protein
VIRGLVATSSFWAIPLAFALAFTFIGFAISTWRVRVLTAIGIIALRTVISASYAILRHPNWC